jgi:hypothetical protein
MSRRNILEHLPADGDLGYLEGDVAAVAHPTFAPILMSFSFKLVSDQSSHGEVQVKGLRISR